MKRKEMVKLLGEFLGVKPKFLNAPTFNYEIVTEEETYTIDRLGTITTSTGEVKTYEEIINPPAPKEEPEQPAEEKHEPLEIDGLEVTLPLEGHTGTTLRNLVNMLFSKQHLIIKAFEMTEPLMDGTFAEDLSSKEVSTFEEFKKALEEIGKEKIPGLTFDFEIETFTIKLKAPNLDPDKIAAFQDLAVLINQSAQKQKRASFKQAQDDNPKYAFRTWLIRLGMNGSEYKTTRKVLLANLEGSGAFRKAGEPNE
ncbi:MULTISPECIES: virulence-related protein [Bacillaceae]|uniref:Virulence-related protein n=1 Tax=Evansella alkalicola TaxID=745819 RepID=A0ABS6JWY9_9BACI|nr:MULTISPECIES: virulence-related protein [Bacillaceae]MBU9723110.1 hypothetical protein [Bacillus alkalicola]